jgi:NAD(P)-dependent dehydrogenase (short-subunit alcohol dehydrogenase family)
MSKPVAIITGGAQGIGLAYGRGFVGEGFRVVLADLLDTTEACAELNDSGGEAIGVHVDVSDEASTEEMAARTVDAFGQIDVLVNNAAYFKSVVRGPFQDMEVAEWDKAFAVNTRGVWLCCKAVFPTMRDQGSGKIINVTSNVAWKGVPGFLHYVSSKSALVGLTRALATELGPHNIAVNSVAPDFIPDEEMLQSRAGHDDHVIGGRAFKRTQTAEDMVGTILYLAGSGSDFVTGQSILVNGGAYYQ